MTDKEIKRYTSNFESKKPYVHSIYRMFREESRYLERMFRRLDYIAIKKHTYIRG